VRTFGNYHAGDNRYFPFPSTIASVVVVALNNQGNQRDTREKLCTRSAFNVPHEL
jgi:hypothetical protein